jgi:hypothetical protein
METLDQVAKAFAVVAVLGYIVGVVVVSAYVYGLGVGVGDLAFLKARYIYTGIIVLISICFSTVAPVAAVLMVRDEFRQTKGRDDLGATVRQMGVVVTAATVLVLPWVMFMFLSSPQFGIADLTQEGAPEAALGLYATSFVAGGIGWAVVAGRGKRVPWYWVLLALLFGTSYLLWFVTLVAREVYPNLPEQFGGGAPKTVQMLFDSDELSGAAELGFEFSSSDRRLSESVTLLFEDEDFFIVRIASIPIQIRKEAVTALLVENK